MSSLQKFVRFNRQDKCDFHFHNLGLQPDLRPDRLRLRISDQSRFPLFYLSLRKSSSHSREVSQYSTFSFQIPLSATIILRNTVHRAFTISHLIFRVQKRTVPAPNLFEFWGISYAILSEYLSCEEVFERWLTWRP